MLGLKVDEYDGHRKIYSSKHNLPEPAEYFSSNKREAITLDTEEINSTHFEAIKPL